jgi:hypothetical protein
MLFVKSVRNDVSQAPKFIIKQIKIIPIFIKRIYLTLRNLFQKHGNLIARYDLMQEYLKERKLSELEKMTRDRCLSLKNRRISLQLNESEVSYLTGVRFLKDMENQREVFSIKAYHQLMTFYSKKEQDLLCVKLEEPVSTIKVNKS